MNKRMKAKFAEIMRVQGASPQISFGRNVGLSHLQKQELWPRRTQSGSPFPFVACSFDELLAPTAVSCYKALVRYAKGISDECDFELPSLSDFCQINIYEERSLLHQLSCSRKRPYRNVWDSYLECLHEVESETPTMLYPWVAETLRSIMEHFHLIVVTSNRTHDVWGMLRQQVEVKQGFDVLKVPRANKALTLAVLAGYHDAHYGKGIWLPFNFFCHSNQDVESAGECGKYISTYRVLNPIYSNESGNFSNGSNHYDVTYVTSDEILSAVYGYRLHSLVCG